MAVARTITTATPDALDGLTPMAVLVNNVGGKHI